QVARAAWPGVELSAEEYVGYVKARHADAHADSKVAWEDLYLACACVKKDATALRSFETAFFPLLENVVQKAGAVSLLDDLRQKLRQRLFVCESGKMPKIADYVGTGPLRHWVRVTATRMVLDTVTRSPPEQVVGDELFVRLLGGADPELEYIKRAYW